MDKNCNICILLIFFLSEEKNDRDRKKRFAFQHRNVKRYKIPECFRKTKPSAARTKTLSIVSQNEKKVLKTRNHLQKNRQLCLHHNLKKIANW